MRLCCSQTKWMWYIIGIFNKNYQKIKTKSRSSPPPSLQSMCFSILQLIFHVLRPKSLRWSIYFICVSSVKGLGHIFRYILKRTTSYLQAYLLLSAVSRKRPERGFHMFYNGGLAQLPANRVVAGSRFLGTSLDFTGTWNWVLLIVLKLLFNTFVVNIPQNL